MFLLERLKYIRGLRGINDEFETFILAFEEIAKMYERMNMLNMKYNIVAGIPPYVLSPDSGFKEKLTQLLEQAYQAESDVVPRIIAYLTDAIKKQYPNQRKQIIQILF